jgi:hypothetical protein
MLTLALAWAPTARAEKVIAQSDNWEIYTDGRVGAFLSYVRGDGFPPSATYTDSSGATNVLYDVKGGGWPDLVSLEQASAPGPSTPSTIETTRVRSGMIGNTLGLGARGTLAEGFKASGYVQFWAWVENFQRITGQPSYADVRQGYATLETRYGSVLAGRMFTLFSRGATDIDTMYAHGWGVGFPGGDNIDSAGFANGQIGFGLLGNGEASAIAYASPTIAGLRLTAGLFDPVALAGPGAWVRTGFARPEAEITFDRSFGARSKLALFTSATEQQVYKQGYCVQNAANPAPCEETAAGVVYGGRFEYGAFHVGASGYYGKGTGLNYALEVNYASVDERGYARNFDGYYLQTQVALDPVDLFAGAGIARLFLNESDRETVQDPRYPGDPTKTILPHSVLKYQLGINAGVVYHVTPYLHADEDIFRAEAAWYLGENQVLYALNGGMTYNW